MADKTDDKILKDAQYRKGLSIAFFNATNSAITLVAQFGSPTLEEAKQRVVELRDFFLEEHKNYYATVIAKVGVNYDVQKTKEKIQATQSIQDLKTIWLMLSEDERRDGEIIKLVQELKKQYEKTQ